MDYFILNEESLPFATREECDKSLSSFFAVTEIAFRNRFTAVRVSEQVDTDWYHLPLLENYYLRNWLDGQEVDYRMKVKSLIDKTLYPQIPEFEQDALERYELSEFFVAGTDIASPSLGAAIVLNQIAISFQSHIYWNSAIINVLHRNLTDLGEIEEIKCNAKNCSTLSHWDDHFVAIEEQRKENYRKGQELWDNRETEFPNLIFCRQSKKYFSKLSISDAMYDRLWDSLKSLNEHICNSTSDDELKALTQLNFSDESDSVKEDKKLKKHRMFTLPDGARHFFGLHVKNFPAAHRLHFKPDYQNDCIFIGYFGKHLPTRKNR